jgi:2-polyprenyl-6-methoxyphenol hydroxylase-like FAD-dependent oxidoreductase
MKINTQGVNVENQILITGAGPAGLALSAELSRRGVKPLLIDRQAAGANTSRACVWFMPEPWSCWNLSA